MTQSVQEMERFCRALTEALRRSGLAPDLLQEAMRAAVAVECVQCGTRISGDELFALSQPPSASLDSERIARLRSRRCACQGCDSTHYRLNFQSYPQIDWPKLLSQVEAIREEQATPTSTEDTPADPGPSAVRPLVSRRLWIALALIVLLLLIRHWHQGGRIPLIHEPEHFRVDPAPSEETQR